MLASELLRSITSSRDTPSSSGVCSSLSVSSTMLLGCSTPWQSTSLVTGSYVLGCFFPAKLSSFWQFGTSTASCVSGTYMSWIVIGVMVWDGTPSQFFITLQLEKRLWLLPFPDGNLSHIFCTRHVVLDCGTFWTMSMNSGDTCWSTFLSCWSINISTSISMLHTQEATFRTL